jgi:hypothetical protein
MKYCEIKKYPPYHIYWFVKCRKAGFEINRINFELAVFV